MGTTEEFKKLFQKLGIPTIEVEQINDDDSLSDGTAKFVRNLNKVVTKIGELYGQ